MEKKFFTLISFLLTLLFLTTKIGCWSAKSARWTPTRIYSCDKSLFVGNIQFPQSLQRVPQISIYRGGIKINTETDNENKNIQFTISDDKNCKTFYILVAETIIPYVKNGTVQYLKVSPYQDYKFYKIDIVREGDQKNSIQNRLFEQNGSFKWKVREFPLGADGRIPDDTLMIIFDPECIAKIEGGTNLELPKIIMKQNMLDLFDRSEEKLREKETELLMSSLDLNIIHTKVTPELKHDHQRKLVVAMANPEG